MDQNVFTLEHEANERIARARAWAAHRTVLDRVRPRPGALALAGLVLIRLDRMLHHRAAAGRRSPRLPVATT